MSVLKLIFTKDFSIENKSVEEKYITKLENQIINYNSELLMGVTYVDDDTYNNCIELLEMLKPNSPILKNDKTVMFVKDLNEDVIEKIENKCLNLDALQFYLNPQGLNVRLVYQDGELIDAHTFGRSFKTQNVFDLVVKIFTNRNDSISDLGNVEIEGVLALPYENIDMAKEFCQVKNPYQGLFSLLNFNEKNEEIENIEDIIHFVATDMFIEGFPFETVSNKYDMLDSLGFIIPTLFKIDKTESLIYDIEDMLYMAENEKSKNEYQTDGVRLLTVENEVILFKIGSWQIVSFSGIVEDIKWVDKKGRKVPILVLKEPIFIDSEYDIKEILLNNVNLLLILDIQIDEEVRFAYFGELGILPITKSNEIILN